MKSLYAATIVVVCSFLVPVRAADPQPIPVDDMGKLVRLSPDELKLSVKHPPFPGGSTSLLIWTADYASRVTDSWSLEYVDLSLASKLYQPINSDRISVWSSGAATPIHSQVTRPNGDVVKVRVFKDDSYGILINTTLESSKEDWTLSISLQWGASQKGRRIVDPYKAGTEIVEQIADRYRGGIQPYVAATAAENEPSSPSRVAAAPAVANELLVPTRTDFPSPPYSGFARGAGLTGSVSVQVTFDLVGMPEKVTVTKSSGNASLDSYTCDFINTHWNDKKFAKQTLVVPISYQAQ